MSPSASLLMRVLAGVLERPARGREFDESRVPDVNYTSPNNDNYTSPLG
jgi:hypothetical protein